MILLQGHSVMPHPRYQLRRRLLVRLVVGLDDVLLDPSPLSNRHALSLSPCTDLSEVSAPAFSARAASAPRAADRRCHHDRLTLYRPALLDERLKRLAKLFHVLFGQVNLVLLPVDGIGNRLAPL